MALLVSRIGSLTFRHRRVTLAVWVLLLVGMSILSSAISKPESTAFSIPGTQSQQAMDLLMGAPSEATTKQLRELHIRTNLPAK